MEWVYQQTQLIHYGQITITLHIHQGEISSIEKKYEEKEKFSLTKGPKNGA